jgi:LPXTG-motif cell wall-anchored protein
MNYLVEPRGQARQIPMGMYQDLGSLEHSQKVWQFWQAGNHTRAVNYTAKLRLVQDRRDVAGFLRKNGVPDSAIKAFQNAVKARRAQLAAAKAAKAEAAEAAARPNYLLWGGVALVAAGGAYFLFFRKKKGQ